MKEQHYFALLDRLQSQGKLDMFVSDMLNVFKDLVNREGQVFPADWLTMYLLQSELLQRSFEFLSLALFHYFSGPNFRADLWEISFLLSVDFACQKHLQVEKFPLTKRQKVRPKWFDSFNRFMPCCTDYRQTRQARQDGSTSERHVGQPDTRGQAGIYSQITWAVPEILASA